MAYRNLPVVTAKPHVCSDCEHKSWTTNDHTCHAPTKELDLIRGGFIPLGRKCKEVRTGPICDHYEPRKNGLVRWVHDLPEYTVFVMFLFGFFGFFVGVSFF